MAEAQDGRAQGASLQDFLSVLFRRKWIVIAIVGTTLAVMVATALRMVPVFQSYATLLVSRGEPTSAYTSNVKLLTWEEELSSELEVIRSGRIHRRAQEMLTADSAKDAAGQLIKIDAAHVSANTPGKSHVIHILYDSPRKEIVQPVVSALTAAYVEFRSDTRLQDPSVPLDEEIEQIRGEIAYWEQRRADFLTNTGSVELPEERANLLSTKRGLEGDLATARSVMAERQARVDWIRESMARAEEGTGAEIFPFPEESGRGESMLAEAFRRLLDVKTAYIEAQAQYTDSHPKVLGLRQQLDGLVAEFKRESETYLEYMTAQLQVARAKVTSFEGSMEYIDSELRTFPDREAQLAGLDRTIGSLRTEHDALVARRADVLTQRLNPTMWDVVVLQDAIEPYAIRRMDYVRLAVIPVFALVLAIGLAFLADGLDQTFRESREVESALRVPSLAAIRQFRR